MLAFLLAFAILCPLGRACTRPKRRHKGALYKAQAEAPSRSAQDPSAGAIQHCTRPKRRHPQPKRALYKAQAQAQSSIVQGPSGGVRSLALATVGARSDMDKLWTEACRSCLQVRPQPRRGPPARELDEPSHTCHTLEPRMVLRLTRRQAPTWITVLPRLCEPSSR